MLGKGSAKRTTTDREKPVPDVVLSKGEATRAQILQAALDLFEKNGYEKTTMRAIAKAAGVSLGNAYYYFRSKEELIQGFYERMHQEHARACDPILERHKTFKQRLQRVMLARQETASAYHQFAGVLFKTAADPDSPLNPFSKESEATREHSIAIFRRVVEGAKEKFPKDLLEDLPEFLWLLQMSMVLYWVHDRSEGCEKSELLVQRSTEMVCKILALIKFPPLRPLRSLAIRTYREFR